ncbi:probable serine carboxypeptidase CPVL isoform X2 [Acanthaster planci]|uniref:Probable serine carboxypeptidase CPVL isoform X2 n=1 Tax=Acanthaster planci TaxID=133434 RepID=A0A8B7YDU1_ACAPL|nr:probable serine carboxypeptidase CPVL isoform X2 [Acanthaster planci]
MSSVVLTTIVVALMLAVMPGALHAVRGPFQAMFAANPPAHADMTGVDPGQPLFLTPYIERGQIQEGQRLSLVGDLNGTSVKSYSGFLTVNRDYNSNMFFWFFPAQLNPEHAPVLLWLQGGPGGTSLFGLFVEHGPFSVTKDLKLLPRKYSWTTKYSMLYIDNPVGTGFSFTKNDQGYARNETAVAKDLYSALVQFFELFPQYQKNAFYATGESYAGKYVPALSYVIHVENPEAKIKINFKGMAIGDGFTAPVKLIPGYGAFMLQTGQADFLQKEIIDKATAEIVLLINAKDWEGAAHAIDLLINSDTDSLFRNITGCTDYYNYMRTNTPVDQSYFNNYLALPEVRKAIHVGNLTFHNGDKVSDYLREDFMQSVEAEVAFLADQNYQILFYSGQLDVIVAAPLTEAFLDQLEWKGMAEYIFAERKIWKVQGDTEVAGYAKKVQNLQQVSHLCAHSLTGQFKCPCA